MIETIFFLPFVLGAILLIAKSKVLNIIAMMTYATVFLAMTVLMYFTPTTFTPYFRTDDLNILFLLVLAIVFFGVAISCIDFLWHSEAPVKSQALFTANLLAFVMAMSGVILSTHLAGLWVFVEATTLASSYLIYFGRSEASLEATWKYLFICSIGIALAFVGIIFLSMGLVNSDSLFFDDLYAGAKNINPFWLKLAFPFMLIGFGTKVGFAPVHAWLPDAHSEAPSPVSALLSGTLLNAALLGVMRVNKIMTHADMKFYADTLLLVIGFTSIFISAVYIISIKNYKRMLAYSSIENMGIIAICLGIGGAGLFAAVIHITAHSLTKAAFFLTSGNILHSFKSKHISDVQGLIKTYPATGWLWLLCFAAIVGIPPFPIFISEFLVAKTMIDGGRIILLVVFLLLLTINMAGIGKAVLRMSFGKSNPEAAVHHEGIMTYLPQVAFIIILLVFGVTMPQVIQEIFQKAAALL